MNKQITNRILFDFEIITFLALIIGLGYFAWRGAFSKPARPGIGEQFRWEDLAMVWFPLLFHLHVPIATYFGKLGVGAEVTDQPSFGAQFASYLIHMIITIFLGVVALFMIISLNRNPIEVFGLNRLGTPKIILIGLAGGIVGYLLCSTLVGIPVNKFFTNVFGELDAQKAVQDILNLKNPLLLSMIIVSACVLAPVIEELLYRGYLYGSIKRFSHPVFAAILSSALFTVIHMNLLALVPLFVLSLILTWLYEFTKCLWVPILVHAFFNTFNILAMFYMKREGVTGFFWF